MSKPKAARCAIYTRVSTDHGLEQDFNSLDSQYDAAQARPDAQRNGSASRRVRSQAPLEAAVAGRLPRGIGVARLSDPPAEWSRQRHMLGLPG